MSVFTASGGSAAWQAGPGTSGTFVDIPELRVWTLRVNKTSKTYASSSTQGGKQRIAGAEDFSGTLSVYIDRSGAGTNLTSFDTDLGIKGGAFGALKLYEASGTNNVFIAPAYIEDVSYNVSVEDDNIVAAEITFNRAGALQYPTT
jgi:hypothetical protein